MPTTTDARPLPTGWVGDGSLRVTPELIEFYTKRARDLRAEAIQSVPSLLWSFLTRIIGRVKDKQPNAQPT